METVRTARESKKGAGPERVFDARRDTTDFRDQMYQPTLIEVPTHVPLEDFLSYGVPVLDQGGEGACTGFGLATVANYLLLRRRVVPDNMPVSPRMLYELARRYDEWPGEDYTGSSARGAMKGWNKHGVCSEQDYPYTLGPGRKPGLGEARIAAAKLRPLGAYFRVNHRDLIAMHSAIAEVGVLYATGTVHAGWDAVGADGEIIQSSQLCGGHAFAIVAYDAHGMWLQNSWGIEWGRAGLGHISYDDWLANGTDVWVARLGAPVALHRTLSFAVAHASSSGQSHAYAYAELRPHLISLGNNGLLKPGGDYGNTRSEVEQIFSEDFPRLMRGFKKKRLLLYAHGGLTSEESAVQRVAEYRPALLAAGIYPLAFLWNSDFWTTISNNLQDNIRRRRPEGMLDAATDFMLDRLDDALEPLARRFSARAAWCEMKENALAAAAPDGGARLALTLIDALLRDDPEIELHLVGHSAGAVMHAPLVQLISTRGAIADGPLAGDMGFGHALASCTLWAPACTVELFKQTYLPAISTGQLQRFALFALSDKAERDDNCARIYNKSLLYLVSNALERYERVPGWRPGVPLLGMERCIRADAQLAQLFKPGSNAELVVAPNTEPAGSLCASEARHHGDFDDDERTVRATFDRIARGAAPSRRRAGGLPAQMIDGLAFSASRAALRQKRKSLDAVTATRQ